ncbi:MAG TPA: tetratricopeptide repeat protein [Pyrinomonadaceae bacterium]|nr:tetratricopeptide repeat protein [Pyrinomonadaceae bacterium]
MKNFYLILLLILITNAPVFAQISEGEAQFNLGRQRFAEKDYDGAIRAYSECLRLSPKQTACYNNRALAYREKSNFSQSIADYTEAIKINPNDASFYNARALVYRRVKKYDLAIADLNASLKINPNDARVKQLLDLVTSIAEDAKKVEAGEAILGGPVTGLLAEGFFARGKEEYEKKDDAAAVESLSQCLRLKPDSADCYFYRGQAYDRKSKYQEAVADYTEAIKLQPQKVEYYRRRGMTNYYSLEKYDAAVADFTEMIKLDPKVSSWYMQRGYAFEKKKDYQRALDDFTRAINLESSGSSKKVYYGARAGLYGDELKNYEASIADLTEIIKIDPTDWMGYANRGSLYLKNKNYEKAIADYTEALKLGATLTASMYEYRARAYCGLGKRALAMADEKKVREAGSKVEFPCQPIR